MREDIVNRSRISLILNEALEGGDDAAGPHAFEKKENLARGEFIEDQVLLWFIALVPYD